MTRRLTLRELNRTLLDRQWLLRRRAATAEEVARHVVGLQAQQGDPPYYGVWCRAEGVTIDDVSTAITDRRLARVVLMRGTIHLATADDCLDLRAVMQPHLDATLWDSAYGKKVTGADPAAIVAAGLAALDDGPLSNKDLSAALAEALPGHDGNALAYLLRSLTPLVQVPPRGVWGAGGALRYASARRWFDREPGTDSTPDETLVRYLAAFGPASVPDMRRWSALSGLSAAVDRLRPRLTVYIGPEGRELYDLADADVVDGDVPAPARLIAPFDNVLIRQTDRDRIVDDVSMRRMSTRNGLVPGTVLLDGFVVGTWKPTITRTTAEATITAHRALTGAERDELAAEAVRTMGLAAPGVDDVRVRFGGDA